MFPYNTKKGFIFWRRRKVPRDRNIISKSMWLTGQKGVNKAEILSSLGSKHCPVILSGSASSPQIRYVDILVLTVPLQSLTLQPGGVSKLEGF